MLLRWTLPTLLLMSVSVGCHSAARSEAKPDSSATSTVTAAAARRAVGTDPGHAGNGTPLEARPGAELAAFAGGCFWGVEDVFRQVPGVVATAVGYTGGTTNHPSYEQVCTHTTGHAETVLVEFDPTKITYAELLHVFFQNHDPTTLNRQGPDIGDQYRSHVFTFSEVQAQQARAAIASEAAQRKKAITTKITPIGPFWKAEEYHQQYDEKTGTHSCPLPKGLPKGA
jgi:peptide-methionine (S)-S-oxide reductase